MQDHDLNLGEERATLTQRRLGSTSPSPASTTPPASPVVKKLDPSKFRTTPTEDDGDAPAKGGAAKVVVWVIIVIVLGVAAYLGLRTVINRNSENVTPTPTATVTPTPDEDSVLDTKVLADSDAQHVQTADKFKLADQTVGVDSEDTFTIDNLLIQVYESFIRFEYVVTSSGNEKLPLVKAAYDNVANRITLSFEKITADNSQLLYGKTLEINGTIVKSITHQVVADKTEKYDIQLNEGSPFVLHSYTDDSENKVSLDIKQTSTIATATPTSTPTSTPEVTDTPDVTSTPVPTNADGELLSNEYSLNNQKIISNVTGKTVKILKYNFGDTSEKFQYNLFLGDGDKPWPNAEATVDGNTVTVVINNLASDALVGTGTGMTDFAAKGVRHIKKVEISHGGGKSTYKFTLDRQLQYRMYIVEDAKQLRLEFKH